jgi:hypothetical protein
MDHPARRRRRPAGADARVAAAAPVSPSPMPAYRGSVPGALAATAQGICPRAGEPRGGGHQDSRAAPVVTSRCRENPGRPGQRVWPGPRSGPGTRSRPGCSLQPRSLAGGEVPAAGQLADRTVYTPSRSVTGWPKAIVLLDLARIWAARGQVRGALATTEAARRVLAATGSVLMARADELEALVRLSIGDLSSPTKLATGLPAVRHGLLLARVALAAGDHQATHEQLQSLSPGDLTPRYAPVRQILCPVYPGWGSVGIRAAADLGPETQGRRVCLAPRLPPMF